MTDFPYKRPVEDLAAIIPDGASIVLPRDHSGSPMEIVRGLIRRGARDLKLHTLTSGGLSADLLIGAGCVAEVETPGISLGEFGPAPRFTNAIKKGLLRIRDTTCPAMHARLQAAEKGVPFMPLRGIIGSDLLKYRPDWQVIDNPFAQNDPIVLLPALQPDFAIFHAAMGDREGNVHVGRRMELKTIAHAARQSLVTVERLHDGDLQEDETLAAGTVPGIYLEAFAEAKGGTWPVAFWDGGRRDDAHLKRYAELARTDEGFEIYLEQFIFNQKVAA